MTPLEVIRTVITGGFASKDLIRSPEWPTWMPLSATTPGRIIYHSFLQEDEAWCEAVLTLLDDPTTATITIAEMHMLLPNRFTMRLLKHPKVVVGFEYWSQFSNIFLMKEYYTDWIVLVPAERVILPDYPTDGYSARLLSSSRKQHDLVVDILAYLVPWRLPTTNPDYQKITKLVKKARDQPAQGLAELVGSHPRLFDTGMAAFKHLPAHLVRFAVTVNTRPDLPVGDSGPR